MFIIFIYKNILVENSFKLLQKSFAYVLSEQVCETLKQYTLI